MTTQPSQSALRVMHDRETPAVLDVMLRLLADHQSDPHHCDVCKLCQDAQSAIALLH